MYKLLIILPLLVMIACTGKYKSSAQKADIGEESSTVDPLSGDTVLVNLDQSIIHWKGTKMNGAGKHEGIVEIRNAYFLSDGARLGGGRFTVDMNTIAVTDIPEHEPVPRMRLNDHLKSADFFAVQNYPTAHFEITKVEPLDLDSLTINGNLTIKNITKNIAFNAFRSGKKFETTFTFDRFQWDITFTGNWAAETFVDKDIELKIVLETE